MEGGNQCYSGPPQPTGSNPPPRQGPSDQPPHLRGYPSQGQQPYVEGNGDHPWGNYTGGGYYNPYFSDMPQVFQRGRWQGSRNTFSYMPGPQRAPYQGTDAYQGRSGPDPGILVYDNIVTGDPRTVMIGEGNRAGGQIRGRISGNRIFRS